ncbi:MAG TPA: sulfotransferase domain-containing protein [Bacteroidia bacterium]|nr:sulfotransferase domain-containing protein [Bacteroidia bacterium]
MGSVKRLVKKSLRSLLPGHAPGFLIIGAQKSGTSSLHYYLDVHPNLAKGRLKEVHFFNRDSNFNRGFGWYEKHFLHPFSSNKLFYEATPNYLYSKLAPERIYKYKPGIKLILVLRNPVDRAYSAWNMYRNFYVSKSIPDMLSKSPPGESGFFLYKYLFENRSSFPSFKECIDYEMQRMQSEEFFEEEPSFIRKGIYYLQLIEYLKFFPKDQLLIFGFKELVDDRLNLLYKIEQFLSVEHFDFNSAHDVINKIVVKKQDVRYAEKLDESIKIKLAGYYDEWNKKLFELTGKPLQW